MLTDLHRYKKVFDEIELSFIIRTFGKLGIKGELNR